MQLEKKRCPDKLHLMMMMKVLCPKAGSLMFTPPGDEMSEVASCTFLTDNYG